MLSCMLTLLTHPFAQSSPAPSWIGSRHSILRVCVSFIDAHVPASACVHCVFLYFACMFACRSSECSVVCRSTRFSRSVLHAAAPIDPLGSHPLRSASSARPLRCLTAPAAPCCAGLATRIWAPGTRLLWACSRVHYGLALCHSGGVQDASPLHLSFF